MQLTRTAGSATETATVVNEEPVWVSDPASNSVYWQPTWNNGTYTYSGLPKFNAAGQEYTYTVKETGFTITVPGENEQNTTQKTFTYTVAEIDGSNTNTNIVYDPTVYTVTVTVTYDSSTGALTATPSYSTTVNGTATTHNEITFTNEELTTVTVTKEWKKKDGTTQAPPTGTVITLNLYKLTNLENAIANKSITLNGTADPEGTGEEAVYPTGNTATNYESDEWVATWTNLPKYESGTEITYVVKEAEPTYGYTVSYNNGVNQYAPNIGTITNTLNETGIKVVKIEANSSPQKRLSGASFTLEKGTTTTTTNEQGTTTTTAWAAYSDSTNQSVKTTGDTGEIAFNDLLDGFYRLVETQAPAGYNSISTPIYFKIEGGTVTWTNEQGQTISTQALVTYTPANTDPATFTVGNTPGVVLPATGGPGTALYTVTGLALTLGAALWLILRRKRKQN